MLRIVSIYTCDSRKIFACLRAFMMRARRAQRRDERARAYKLVSLLLFIWYWVLMKMLFVALTYYAVFICLKHYHYYLFEEYSYSLYSPVHAFRRWYFRIEVSISTTFMLWKLTLLYNKTRFEARTLELSYFENKRFNFFNLQRVFALFFFFVFWNSK